MQMTVVRSDIESCRLPPDAGDDKKYSTIIPGWSELLASDSEAAVSCSFPDSCNMRVT